LTTVSLIDPCEDPRWENFIDKHQFGWITHSTGWKRVLEAVFPHLKGYYHVIIDDQNKEIIAGLPVFKVSSTLTGKRMVSIPFATLCDPLVSSVEDAEILSDAVLQMAQKFHCKYVEIRCMNSGSLIKNNKYGRSDFFICHSLKLDESLEKLWKHFHRTCVKQRIKRAEKRGLNLIRGDTEIDLLKFYKIYIDARRRILRPPLPFKFLNALWQQFHANGQIELLLAMKDDQILAGILFFKFKNRVSIEFAASLESAWNLSPNHMLFWEAIKIAHAEGYEIIDFGRTSPNNASLMDFKRRWGTEKVILPHFYFPGHIANEQTNKELSMQHKVVEKICRHSPQFMQPLIGNFCYRHLA
jgi:hypothetical protein